MDILTVVALLFGLLALVFLVLSTRAFRGRRPLGGSVSLLAGLLFLALGALSVTLSLATRGYRALTHEEVAAVVETRPAGEHAFEATFHFPDGEIRTFRLQGDQIYVDARILKWEPVVNVLGLHTAYQLDRVAGRYLTVEEERTEPRSVHSLAREGTVDMLGLLERLPFLERIVDAEYGSGTFLEVERPARLEIRVSTSGLLIRRAELTRQDTLIRRDSLD
jgi:hypothetical protein